MRIISKFTDYYDNVQGFGIDKSLVYVRNTQEVGKGNFEVNSSNYSFDQDRMYSALILVGFCGKIYPLIKVEFTHGSWGISKSRYFAYSRDDLLKIAEKENVKESKLLNLARGTLYNEDFFSSDRSNYSNLFFEYKTPVFAKNITGYLEINPCLKDFEFFKVVDPFTAFQEVSMYLGGVLGVGEPNTVAISDKMMACKKGFDKQSFRTQSPGKKAKRRNMLS